MVFPPRPPHQLIFVSSLLFYLLVYTTLNLPSLPPLQYPFNEAAVVVRVLTVESRCTTQSSCFPTPGSAGLRLEDRKDQEGEIRTPCFSTGIVEELL